jgi:hypothetical protein
MTPDLLVISGGQTGADQGGLYAARLLHIKTGGWIPKGFRTERGSEPDLAAFGLKETQSDGWLERTTLNAIESDITLWFGNPNSPGGKVTRQACKDAHDTPFIDVTDWTPEAIAALLWYRKVNVVNIAGNRESKNPGIQSRVQHVLVDAFGEYKMLQGRYHGQ